MILNQKSKLKKLLIGMTASNKKIKVKNINLIPWCKIKKNLGTPL